MSDMENKWEMHFEAGEDERAKLYKRIAALEAENARLIEALTPSGDTKAAYSGEFKIHIFDYMDEETEDEIYRDILIPWDQIKQIMKAIKARAELENKED